MGGVILLVESGGSYITVPPYLILYRGLLKVKKGDRVTARLRVTG